MRTTRALCLSLLCTAGVSLQTSASAQTKTQSGEFTVQNFAPAPGTKNFLGVETLRMEGNWGFSAGVFFNYAKNPFVVLSCRSETDCADKNATNKTDTRVVSDMLTWDLLAAISPIPRLQIGLRLPVSYVQGDGLDVSNGQPLTGGIAKLGVGDPMLEGKVRIFGGAQDPFLLGAAVDVSFPVGHAFSDSANNKQFYLGNSSPVTVGIRGIFDGAAGPLQFGINLRGVIREKTMLATTEIGPLDFRYGAGLGYRISPIFRLIAEGFGSTQFSSKNGTNTLEIDGAAELSLLESRLIIRAGGGAGVLQGVGVPAGRAFLGVAFAREVGDQDGDGIPDTADKCPTIPEDKDGFEDDDGCPDPDNDGDRIPDEKDKCPDKMETVNGYLDDDGCPDEISDRDKDGVPDEQDKCPDAGGKSIMREDEDGCPDKGPSLVQISDSGIKILDKVEFATGKDVIQGNKSFKVLDAVAGVLNGHKDVWLVEVAGHTDNSGSASDNRALSQKRAEAVVKYLIGKKVEPTRLVAKGYGPDKPIADNKTGLGRQKNRRVEFVILRSNKNPGAAPGAPPAKK